MPRRSRPWCSTARLRPSILVSVARGAAGIFMIGTRISTAFVHIQHSSHTPSFARTSVWPTLDGQRSTSSRGHCGGAVSARRRRSDVAVLLRMAFQQQETEEVVGEYAALLAEDSAAGTAVAKPFVTRKLGSFEKMLTQTRDGVGPAEEGIRTLLTPHVWVSIFWAASVSGSVRMSCTSSIAGGCHTPFFRAFYIPRQCRHQKGWR